MIRSAKYCLFFLAFCTAVPDTDARDRALMPNEAGVSAMIPEGEQEESRTADSHHWNSLRADSAFWYRNEKEAEVKTGERDGMGSWLSRLIDAVFNMFHSGFGRFLFWIFVLSSSTYVLYRIFKGDIRSVWGRREQRKEDIVMDVITPDDLLHANWQEQLDQACLDGDLRLATRFAYVSVLQLLHSKGLIEFSIDTTNFEYYRALKDGELKPLFRELLLRYEYAWFGRFRVGQKEWEETWSLYQQLKRKL